VQRRKGREGKKEKGKRLFITETKKRSSHYCIIELGSRGGQDGKEKIQEEKKPSKDGKPPKNGGSGVGGRDVANLPGRQLEVAGKIQGSVTVWAV